MRKQRHIDTVRLARALEVTTLHYCTSLDDRLLYFVFIVYASIFTCATSVYLVLLLCSACCGRTISHYIYVHLILICWCFLFAVAHCSRECT